MILKFIIASPSRGQEQQDFKLKKRNEMPLFSVIPFLFFNLKSCTHGVKEHWVYLDPVPFRLLPPVGRQGDVASATRRGRDGYVLW
eukprot:COSAG02_NODE_360_length_23829_cov_107.112769_5_plen_86_part_00